MSGADEETGASSPPSPSPSGVPARRSKRPSLRVPVNDVDEGRAARTSEVPAATVAEAAVVVVRGSSAPREAVAGFETLDDPDRAHPAFGTDESSSPATRFDDVTLPGEAPSGLLHVPTEAGLGAAMIAAGNPSSIPPRGDGLGSDAEFGAMFSAESAPLGGAGGRLTSSLPPLNPAPASDLDVSVEVDEPVTSPGTVVSASAGPSLADLADAANGDSVLPQSDLHSIAPAAPSEGTAEARAPRAPAEQQGAPSPVDKGATPHAVPPPPPAEARKPAPPPPAPPPPPVPRESRQQPTITDPSKRPWFEVFFDDDYLRTVQRPVPAAVERQCTFIEEQLGLAKGARILDVGCGLGLQAVELAKRGYQVTALDLSESMLRRAKSEALVAGVTVNFVHGDMRQLHLEGRFDAVLCWGTTFGYFDDDVNRKTMEALHACLKPMGVLLMEVVNRDYVIQSQPQLVWFEGDGCVCIEETSVNYITSRLLVKRTVIRDDGHQYENFYSVRLYSIHELGQLMHNRGFRVLRVSSHESLSGVFFGADSPRMIILAEKRVATAHTIRDTVREPGKRDSLSAAREERSMKPTAAPAKPSSVPPPPQKSGSMPPPASLPPTPQAKASVPPPRSDDPPDDDDKN